MPTNVEPLTEPPIGKNAKGLAFHLYQPNI